MTKRLSNEELLDAARNARARAYAPYSKYTVGAAVDVGDGRIFTGANVENAAYPLSTCAERVAITQAVSAGHRTIVAIAVAGPPGALTAPCGGCRQIIAEFGSAAVVLFTAPDGMRERSIEELLPETFGSAAATK